MAMAINFFPWAGKTLKESLAIESPKRLSCSSIVSCSERLRDCYQNQKPRKKAMPEPIRSLSMVNGSELPFNQIQMRRKNEIRIDLAAISLLEEAAKHFAEIYGILDDNPDNPAANRLTVVREAILAKEAKDFGATVIRPAALGLCAEEPTAFNLEAYFSTLKTLQEFQEYDRSGSGPVLIADDASLLIHEGVKAEEEFTKTGKLRDPKSTTNLEFQKVLGLTNRSIKVDLLTYHRMKERWVGASGDTTTVVKRLNHMQHTAAFLFPAIMVSPFTKIKYDSLVGCGYGDVGKPFCAVKPVMEALPEVVFGTADIMVDQYMRKWKNNSIDCNIGQYDNSFYMQRFEFKTQTDKRMFPDAKGAIIPLAQGRLNNLGCATGHPSFVMFCSFTKQVIPQLELWNEKKSGKYEEKVYVLHKHLVEKVAALNLQKLGAKLTKLSPEQAAYINVPIEGPYEPAHYRY